MIDILKKSAEIITSLGFDVAIIVGIVITTAIFKLILNTKGKYSIIVAFVVGIAVGISIIIINKIPTSGWLRLVFGYPGFSCFLYMILCKFFPGSTVTKIVKTKGKK